jgi:TolB-like protein/Tfp pilus assembly protein PilF
VIGKTVSHYRIIEKLGGGGMGVVYRAEDVKLGREVALKFLPPELTRDTEARARFLREARAAAALNHPNICTIHEIDKAEGHTFIAMELIDGGDLRARIALGPLAIDEAVEAGAQIADGLAEAHRRGIVHRDIKPANIMLTPEGRAKIMDFGLARLAGTTDLTRTGTTLGTVAYMSPEQARGEPVDARTDVWSLGVVLYEMITGRRPFEGERDHVVIRSILNDEPEGVASRVAGAPADLVRVVSKALAKYPAARYQNAGDLATDLRTIQRKLQADPTRAVAETPEPAPSIAVLPFANMSPDPENAYFGDGLAEELVNALAQLPGLRVAARTSAFQFRGKDADIREIGAKLNVGAVLEGSVRKAGNRLRVTAQLIDVADGFHMWSERYDREMEDIFELQDEITAAIVKQLRGHLGPAPEAPAVRRHTDNLDAYALYLKGRYYWNSLTAEGLRRSRECYEKAVEIDPEYALAHAALSMWHQSLAFWADSPPGEAFALSRAAAERAIELDDTIALAHNCLAVIRFSHDWEWDDAEQGFRRVIELDPSSPFGHINYALLLANLARHEEALKESGIARRLDPLSTPVDSWAAAILVMAGRVREGIATLEDIVTRDQDAWQPHFWLSEAYSHAARKGEAIAAAERAAELAKGLGVPTANLACAYYLGGRCEDGRRTLSELEGRARTGYVSPTLLAWIHVARGAADEAVPLAERAYEEGDPWLLWSGSNPPGMRFEDPRLVAILRRTGVIT